MLSRKYFKISLIISSIACLPLTGFIYGFIICSDCGNGFESITGRIFLGFIYTFFTILSFGKPWIGGGVLSHVNLRPYVLLSFILIFVLVYTVLILQKNRKQINKDII